MYTFGVVISALTLAPITVALAAVIVIVMMFNFIVRELMIAAWDLSVQAISEIEVFVNDLVSEKNTTSVVKEVTTK